MGAHQSQSGDRKWGGVQSTVSGQHQYAGHLTAKHGHTARQGKPSPPNGIPMVSDVTHNSLSLSWQPPKLTNGSILAYMVEMKIATDKEWITLTKSCQGTWYRVRNLDADCPYKFRVRAENIFGRSKPGNISEIVQTSSFDVHDFVPCKEIKAISVKRRSSLNTQVPVEGRVAAILNHSSPVIETMLVSSMGGSRGSLQRDVARASLKGQTLMKRSGSSLIPGTRTNCLTKLRTSQTKVQNIHNIESRKNRNSLGNSSEKIYLNGDSDCRSDFGSECNTVSQSSGSEYLLQDHNANEKFSRVDDSVNGELLCHGLKQTDCVSYSDERLHFVRDEGIDTSSPANPDFRTLRSMLQSSDVIIKPTLSLPEISDMCRGKSGRVSLKHKLTTIVDEEDDVRVTTL